MKRKPRLKWDPVNKLFTVCAWCERDITAIGEAHTIATPAGWQRSHGICRFHQHEMKHGIQMSAREQLQQRLARLKHAIQCAMPIEYRHNYIFAS